MQIRLEDIPFEVLNAAESCAGCSSVAHSRGGTSRIGAQGRFLDVNAQVGEGWIDEHGHPNEPKQKLPTVPEANSRRNPAASAAINDELPLSRREAERVAEVETDVQ